MRDVSKEELLALFKSTAFLMRRTAPESVHTKDEHARLISVLEGVAMELEYGQEHEGLDDG